MRYSKWDQVLSLLPTVSQLKYRAHRLHQRGDFDISTYADVMVWATPRICTDTTTFFSNRTYNPDRDVVRFARQPFEVQNELLMLDTFTDTLENGEVSLGIIITSRKLFRTGARMMSGQEGGEALESTDGTYKLHFGGWTLISFGTFELRYTAFHKYQQKFYPLAFMFVRTETSSAYAKLFSVCKVRCKAIFRVTLNIQFGSLDHSTAIVNAFREEWPDIELLDCWPHLDRNARKKRGILEIRERYNGIIKPQLDYRSVCRSKEQFEVLSELVTQNWSDIGEGEYADWLIDEYLMESWDIWYCTSSGIPEIVPNQNPIESHHNAIKTVAVNQLRASTGHVLASTLPRILVECAMEIGSGPIEHFAAGPVSAELLQDALLLCDDDNHYPPHKRKTRHFIRNIEEYYFNQTHYLVQDENAEGLKVTSRRCKMYANSLRGMLEDNEVVNKIQLRHLSLHVVTILDRLPYEHDWNSPSWSLEEIDTIRHKFKCDCKDFYHTGWLRSHVLACLHLVDNLDLKVMLRELPTRKPPGRPRKKTKCLQRYGVRTTQYSVEALVRRLVKKTASVINWSVLIEETVTEEDDEESQRTYVGWIKPPFSRGGKRFWEIKYEDRDEVTTLEVEPLARAINFSFQMGHNIVA